MIKPRKITPSQSNEDNVIRDEQQARRDLTRLLVNGVKKNLDTSIPTAVLLSGGVGSSLIMEIAHRLHPQVTAFVVGAPGSPDYEAAVKLCKRQKYNYRVMPPRSVDLMEAAGKSLARFGIKTVFTGEGANELFAGETDCLAWIDKDVNQRCSMLLKEAQDSYVEQQKNLKKIADIKLKAPFLDQKVTKYALNIDGPLKIRRANRCIVTKHILRVVASDFLPGYIVKRYSLPFPYGTGFGFNELTIAKETVVRTLPKNHLLIAQFDKLALYFPLYYAAQKGFFKKRKLEVDFVATGGDDNTYISLLAGGAHIGIADPIFSYADYGGVKSEIIGELIGRLPIKAVAFKSDIEVNILEDLNNYKIGTFNRFTTTHTVATYLLPDADLESYDYSDLEAALASQEVDIVITIPEFAEEIISRGGKMVYDFKKELPHYLFSGFFTSKKVKENLGESHDSFILAVKDAIKNISDNPQEALEFLKTEFPALTRPEETLSSLTGLWSKDLKIRTRGLNKAKLVWNSVYPWLIKTKAPSFMQKGVEDKIVAVLTDENFSRYHAYQEDELRQKIKYAIEKETPIILMGYWDVYCKSKIDKKDKQTVSQLSCLMKAVKELHKPGLEIKIILADEHARFHGFKREDYMPYLEQVEKQLVSAHVQPIWLRSLWRRWRIREDIISRWRKRFESRNAQWWEKVSIKSQLEKRAGEFVGKNSIERVAQSYYIMRYLENRRILRDFDESIFITYLSDDYQKLLPDMAILYLWGNQR